MICWLLITVLLVLKILKPGDSNPNKWFLILIAWLVFSAMLVGLGHPANLVD
jgi:Kef-type K+ transport system membrane component KefB